MEAQSLVAKDNLMGGMKKGKSDPYAKISVGGLVFKSAVVKENLNPVWNELYEVCMKGLFISLYNKPTTHHQDVKLVWWLFQVVLRPQSGQEVQVELNDKDMDKDDFLGRWECFSEEVPYFYGFTSSLKYSVSTLYVFQRHTVVNPN